MQFQVPQFTDVEDKIFGPLTLKQFIYVAGGVGVGFLLWRYLPSLIAIPLALAIVGFAAALAFVKVNKKPLIITLEAAFMYFIHKKLYLWNSNYKNTKKRTQTETSLPQSQQDIPSVSENKLKSLAWSLDINERIRLDREKEEQEEIS
ncbi:PrgI family protein [Candidatus Kaiserbacteria bacterium]|nr:MAG: PrgI family protein [Candidatus Kaiserbacteria bacterium]